MLLKAPAKINLTLRILSKRADGYHEIESKMRAIRLFDEVEISLVGDGAAVTLGSRPGIRVRTDMAGVPCGPENLAYRAAELAFETWGGEDAWGGFESGGGEPCVEIMLRKSIPMAAGLAGGSANAAAVLLGLTNLFAPKTDIADIAAVGARLGADIPFCVYSCAAANPALGYKGTGTALAEGVGERLTPIAEMGDAWVVLVKPNVGIDTKEAYAAYDAYGAPAPHASDNDFETPCSEAYPIVAETLATLKRLCAEEGAGDAKIQLSGSGPTVFAYFEGLHEAASEAAELIHDRARQAFPKMFSCITKTL
ncbi:MAG: 4-(cytidine 5'-diphospho)-2-C-methyl-D-erythritol kinase [Clostridiales bacterium]|nr:4-(cytidine 5'-diphospho)-2-C-methyl-D-erythritol kinase [Clostridiales bacterium]